MLITQWIRLMFSRIKLKRVRGIGISQGRGIMGLTSHSTKSNPKRKVKPSNRTRSLQHLFLTRSSIARLHIWQRNSNRLGTTAGSHRVSLWHSPSMGQQTSPPEIWFLRHPQDFDRDHGIFWIISIQLSSQSRVPFKVTREEGGLRQCYQILRTLKSEIHYLLINRGNLLNEKEIIFRMKMNIFNYRVCN